MISSLFELTYKYCQQTCCCKVGCLTTAKDLLNSNDDSFLDLYDEDNETPLLGKHGCKIDPEKRKFCSDFICTMCIESMTKEDYNLYNHLKHGES